MRKPRWTLRLRLIVPAAAIVTILSAIGALLQTDTLVRAWIASTRQLGELATRQVTQFILLRLEESRPPSGTVGRDYWLRTIDSDAKLAGLLESAGAGAHSIAEISVADSLGLVLASSNRARPGKAAARVRPLTELETLNPLTRLREVWAPGHEYDLRAPIGIAGDSEPLFVVQVLVSNALLREVLGPGIRRILATTALAYMVALLLVFIAAEAATRNLRRIGQLIDRIAEGGSILNDPEFNDPESKAPPEFDAVRSKLSLMEGRVRGALTEAEDYRQRVSTLLKGLEEGIILFEGERVILVAGATENLLGWSTGEVSGRHVSELFRLDSPLMRMIAGSWQSGRPVHNARIENLIANLDYIEDAGEDAGADAGSPPRRLSLLRVRDAEGASEVESHLQVVSRLEAINRLTGGVAHEIKNPLNAIAARLGLLESIVEGDPEAEGEIRVVATEIQRLDRVVRTFLDFTQPLEARPREIDLGVLAANVAELLRPEAEAKGITLEYQNEGDSLPVWGDSDILQQAFVNIVVNAIEATPKGGVIQVTATASDRFCRVRISDTGPGIPESVRNRIFQLYYTTKKGGSGIGLAIAYRSLQLHGGDLRVETEMGKGTTFELALPTRQREMAGIA